MVTLGKGEEAMIRSQEGGEVFDVLVLFLVLF